MKLERKLRKVGRRQVRLVPGRVSHVKRILERKAAKSDRRLYAMKPQDELRLLRLLQWSEKYSVPVSYILDVLLPYWQKKLEHWSRRKSQGLGVRVHTLVGKVSEYILQKEIKKDFPDSENVLEAKWKRKLALLELRNREEQDLDFKPVSKGPLDYGTLGKFVRSYRRSIADSQRELDKAIASKKNTLRKYRSSPWI